MQTAYNQHYTKAIAGMCVGPKKTKPRTQPLNRQTITGVIANSEAGTMQLRLTDNETGQVWDASVTVSGATEATTLNEIVAAWRANGKFNDLFTITDNDTDTYTIVARLPGKSFTHTSSGPGSMTNTITQTVASGGLGVGFGLAVVRGTADDEFTVVGATSTLNDVIGLLERTDGNHFHDLPVDLGPDDPNSSDLSVRGKTQGVIEQGRMWVIAEDAVVPGGPVYIRRATTSGAGTVGAFRGTQAGTAQTVTVTPIVNQAIYGFSFAATVGGVKYEIDAVYMPTDATTSIADACAGLFDAVTADIAAKGLTASLTPTDNGTTLTIAGAAGMLISEVSGNVWYLDTEAATVTIAVSAADIDTIFASDKFEWETTAAAGALALLKIKLA